jgi:hypothetical protein
MVLLDRYLIFFVCEYKLNQYILFVNVLMIFKIIFRFVEKSKTFVANLLEIPLKSFKACI